MPKISTELSIIAGIPITVLSDTLDMPNITLSARHVLGASGTTYQFINTEFYTRRISGIIWSGFPLLPPMAGSGSYNYASDQGYQGEYFIETVKGERVDDWRTCDIEDIWEFDITMRRTAAP